MIERSSLTADDSFANRRECGPSSVGISTRSSPVANIRPPITHKKARTIRGILRPELFNGVTEFPIRIERSYRLSLRGLSSTVENRRFHQVRIPWPVISEMAMFQQLSPKRAKNKA